MAKQPTQAERNTKERDIDGIVRYLTNTFNTATAGLEKPYRNPKTKESNAAYKMQTEFAYRLNEVVRGAPGVMQRNIADCNEYIDFAITEVDRIKKQK